MLYSWVLRELNLAPIDVIGFSTGGWTAAEMASVNAKAISQDGAGRARRNQAARRGDHGHLLGHGAYLAECQHLRRRRRRPSSLSSMAASALPSSSRPLRTRAPRMLGSTWEPIMNNPSLPYFLQGVSGLPTQIIWGREDAIVAGQRGRGLSQGAEQYRSQGDDLRPLRPSARRSRSRPNSSNWCASSSLEGGQ